jgi:hypothetical protein
MPSRSRPGANFRSSSGCGLRGGHAPPQQTLRQSSIGAPEFEVSHHLFSPWKVSVGVLKFVKKEWGTAVSGTRTVGLVVHECS